MNPFLATSLSQSQSLYVNEPLGHTFLICWITLAADMKKLGFQKKKIKKLKNWRFSGEKCTFWTYVNVAETLYLARLKLNFNDAVVL